MSWIRFFLLFIATLSLASPVFAIEQRLHIAVAANFRTTLDVLIEHFTRLTSAKVIVSASSTGVLYTQIRNGAPFDIFLAADARRPEMLVAEQLAVNRFTYAIGQLVLWVPGSKSPTLDYLDSPKGPIAMANPGIAPYGLAAKQLLVNTGRWKTIQASVVLGNNVGQTFQYIYSGNASAGLVSYSQLRDLPGDNRKDYLLVPHGHYDDIVQQAVVLTAARNKGLAESFARFLRSASAKTVLTDAGYKVPEADS